MNTRAWLILLLLAVGIATGFYFLTREDKKTTHNWSRTLHTKNKEPYDISLFLAALRKSLGSDFHTIQNNSGLKNAWHSLQDGETKGTYFFIGDELYLTDEEMDLLVMHVKSGGTAFISASSIPQELFEKFPGLETRYLTTIYSDSIELKFSHATLKKDTFLFENKVKDKTQNTYWQYIGDRMESENQGQIFNGDDKTLVHISTIQNVFTDFVYLKFGQGRFYIHSNPVFLANYYLKRQEGRKYASYFLKHIPSQPLWLDMSASFPKPDAKKGYTEKSVFDFLDQNKPLKYAWWILVASVLLFLFTGGRRKQRSIPIIQTPSNNSLTLVESLGYFYFTQNKNALVFKREWNQFLNFIRFHLRINTDMVNEDTMQRISHKSGVALNTIQDIFHMYEKYKIFSELSGNEMIQINKTISKFYLEYYNKNGK
ncbi:MAG: hypothetical protein KG003_11330 [Bacteroidetes bacterium]|nr:hypothetical protein [Bacteroidota bacterium]